MIRKYLLCSLALLFPAGKAAAQVGNAWHIPANIEQLSPASTGTMREPFVEIDPAGSVLIYQGVFKGSGDNQVGGELWYRNATAGEAWQSDALTFHANVNPGTPSHNQFWRGAINLDGDPTDVFEYYVFVDYEAAAGQPQDTYLHGGDLDGNQLASLGDTAARANPYSFRNRPGWIFHADNRVAIGNDVQFWAKVGYIGNRNDPATRWANHGALYFTTDGSEPAGSLGLASGSSTAVPFSYDHPEQNDQDNGSITGGIGMWWKAQADGLPDFTEVRYRIGFWHDDTNEEKFADFNAGGTRTFQFSLGTLGEPLLTVNGVNANYTTSKLFVDEIAGDSIPLDIRLEPGVANLTEAEVFTNLNRRDRADGDANGDGVEDGIHPPDPDTISAVDTNHYYRAWTMTPDGPGAFGLVLNAEQCGAYRLTARWKVQGDPNWHYYSVDGRRDHAITVTPIDARDIRMYEINTLSVEARDAGGGFIERSTFEDLHDAPGAPRTSDGAGFNLDYLTGLGINWLWFQPIHPPGIAGREIDPSTSQPYNPGSPYAVKNFFEVNPWMSAAFAGGDEIQGRIDAMQSFQVFAAAADAQGVEIMLDAPFNHSAFDCELAQTGVELFQPDGQNWSPGDEIRNREARFYSKSGDYCARAANAGDIAVAPDRGDFGKWNDVVDVFFGRYDALVCQNPADNASHLNEGDRFDYTDPQWTGTDFMQNAQPRNVTRRTWKYFAQYAVHWLEKTGYTAAVDPLDPANRNLGIDGLRCDFGQGLPPQCWEYIINVARTRKWNFVMMSESLDGGAVTYRSNRHFDILNENIVFPLKSANDTGAYRQVFEDRRGVYGEGLVLLNNTSHDEENFQDPFEAFIRYAVGGSIDGAPLIFFGQELGISRTFGFTFYETNFGKQIGHFKKFNSLTPLRAPGNRNFGIDQLYEVFAGVGRARRDSPALRSSNRFFLNRKSGHPHPQIFSVAKYETGNGSPAFKDVVFAMVNLDRNAGPDTGADPFELNIERNGSNLFGIRTNRVYNVKNRAAYLGQDANRNELFLWGAGMSGADVLNNGVFAGLNPVPSVDQGPGGWDQQPYEAQYLKLYDVTPPPPSGLPMPDAHYSLGGAITFHWDPPAAGPDDHVTGYTLRFGSTPGGNELGSATISSNQYTLAGPVTTGTVVFATIIANSVAGIPSDTPAQSAATADRQLAHSAVIVLDPFRDEDNDRMSNEDEDLAGTDPLDPASVFTVAITENGARVISISTMTGRSYTLEFSDDLGDPAGSPSWNTFANAAAGTFTETAGPGTHQFTDDFSAASSGTVPFFDHRAYRVRIEEATPP